MEEGNRPSSSVSCRARRISEEKPEAQDHGNTVLSISSMLSVLISLNVMCVCAPVSVVKKKLR